MATFPLKVYISYSDEDEVYKKDLERHLKVLEFTKKIKIWSRSKVLLGEIPEIEAKIELKNAQIILIILSTNYYLDTNNFRYELEMAKSIGAIYIPVIVDYVDIGEDKEWKYHYFPKDGQPIIGFEEKHKRENVYGDIAKELRRYVEQLDLERKEIAELVSHQYEKVTLYKTSEFFSIYVAHDKFLRRKAIIKAVNPQHPLRYEDLERLIKEAQGRFEESEPLSTFRHRNIMTIYAIRLDNVAKYFILEYINGLTLKEIINSEGRQPFWEVKKLLCQISEALYYGHQRKLVHQYLTPNNIMVDEEFMAVISPFRLIKTNQLKEKRENVENLTYWAPEQVRGEDVSEKADQFALGLIAFELITGQPFYQADKKKSISTIRNELVGIENEVTKRLRKVGCPDPFINLIIRLTKMDPLDRYDDMMEVSKVLYDIKIDLEINSKLVLQSYRRANKANPHLIRDFYKLFFSYKKEEKEDVIIERKIEFDPQNYFGKFKAFDWDRQEAKVRHTVRFLLELPKDFPVGTLSKIIKKHSKIPDLYYQPFADCLIKTIKNNDRMWNEAIESAWKNLMVKATHIMLQDEKDPA